MLAERMPQADFSILTRPLAALTRLVVRFPRVVVGIAILATLCSLYLSFTKLSFRTSRADLLSPDSEYNQRWLKYTAEFGDREDVVVVVEGASPEAISPVLDEIAAAVEREPHYFQAAWHKIDLANIRGKGLHYVEPKDLLAIEGFLDKASPILRGDWAQLNLGNMSGVLGSALQTVTPEQRQQAFALLGSEMKRMTEALAAALGPNESYRSPWPEMGGPAAALSALGSNYLMSDDGRLGFVLLQFAKSDTANFAQNSEALDTLREIIDRVKSRHPETKVGLTGLPVIENDEMRGSNASMTIATILSCAGVFLVVLLAFGGVRHSAMVMACLLVGMVLSCGATALLVGYVNLMSIAFGSILLGLGVDYGIAFLAGYVQLRPQAESTEEAIVETGLRYGPSITTGAITSAIAFFMVSLTDFTGIAQLGLIAGVGILLCLVVQLTLLPAAIYLMDARRAAADVPVPLDLGPWFATMLKHPRWTLIGTVGGTLLVAVAAQNVVYDYNLMKLQADGVESVAIEQKLATESRLSASFALSVADTPEEAVQNKAKFMRLSMVDRVDEIASALPQGDVEKRPIIERIHARLSNLPAAVPNIPVVPQPQLEQVLIQAEKMLAMAPEAAEFAGQLRPLRELVRSTPAADYYRRMSTYQQAMAGDLLARLQTIESVSEPATPTVADLPSGMSTRFVSPNGKFLLRIYAKVNLWDMAGMKQFAEQVRTVDENVTGNPLQIYEASRHMKRSYDNAAWYALLGVLPVVFFDLRRLGHVCLAMLPLVFGMVQLVGIMGCLDLSFNQANMITVPFLLGIGLENGIHLVHGWRRQIGKYQGMDTSTSLAVVVNSLTTMVGFAALMIANHKGLQSLGRVLTIGMSCCLLNALLLPNLLVLFNRFRNRIDVPPAEEPAMAAQTEADLQREPLHEEFIAA